MTDPYGRFAELVRLPARAVPLDEAAMLVAAHARPGLDVAAQLARIDNLGVSCPGSTLADLRHHLFDDCGFTGNHADYYDPANSMLDQVLDRRVGIPISLGALTIEVARRVGVTLVGVGMPGHFLVGVPERPGVYLDPFAGGAVLDEAACRQRFAEAQGNERSWHPSFLAPADTLQILDRLLGNLRSVYASRGDLASLRWVLELGAALPAEAGGRWEALASELRARLN